MQDFPFLIFGIPYSMDDPEHWPSFRAIQFEKLGGKKKHLDI